MFRIGQFSKLTQVSIRMLRHYDEIGLLKPVEVDNFTGYRMYSAAQIPLLQKIILLRDSEFKIAEIKEIISNYEDKNMIELLEMKKINIQKKIDLEKQRIEQIEKTINQIKSDNLDIHCNINFKKTEEFLIVSTRDIIPSYFDECLLWEKLCRFTKEENISVKNQMYNNIAFYHDIDHKDKNVDVEVGLVVDKLGENKNGFVYREVEAIEKVAYAMIYGPYKNLAKGYEKLAYYLEENNMQMAYSPSRQICYIGVDDTENPEEYLTEIQIPIL